MRPFNARFNAGYIARSAGLVILLLAFLPPSVSATAPLLSEAGIFAMDTGTRDSNHKTSEEQAALVKELGYTGIGFGGCADIPGKLSALKAQGLTLSTIYTGLEVKPNSIQQDPALGKAMMALKGEKTIIWLYVGGKRPKDPAATDAPVVQRLQKLADLAATSNLKIALYPHAGAYADRVDDCVRLVKKADRKNLGVTFNLCHWLKVDGKHLEQRLKEAMPHLFVVTINGADQGGRDWATLIQPLDQGSYDVAILLRDLKSLGFSGPIGLQHYGIRGDAELNLAKSMAGWQLLQQRLKGKPEALLQRANLDAWRRTSDWAAAGDVKLDPEESRRLAWKPGHEGVINGSRGRTGHLVSKLEFSDVEAHIEFIVSKHSNSGIYFMGRYELQVFDSHGVTGDEYPGIECGGIYPRFVDNARVEGHSPRVNASRPAGEWQSFDVIFRAPRFDAKGQKTANAKFIKVWHNGVLIHENVELKGPTRASLYGDEKATGPLMLQGDHGPVAYRKVSIIELN